jgi:hypothetical protein
MKTLDELADKWGLRPCVGHGNALFDFKDDLKGDIRDYARAMCEKQRKICAKPFKSQFYYHIKNASLPQELQTKKDGEKVVECQESETK